jgi:hypothetical protein
MGRCPSLLLSRSVIGAAATRIVARVGECALRPALDAMDCEAVSTSTCLLIAGSSHTEC